MYCSNRCHAILGGCLTAVAKFSKLSGGNERTLRAHMQALLALAPLAARSLHVAVTSFSTPSEIAGLRWDAITHLHQAINPLTISAAGDVLPSLPSTWPEASLIEAARGNLSQILVPVHMVSKPAAELFFAKSHAEIAESGRKAVAAALSAGYDGLSVDIEGLQPTSKEGFEVLLAACAGALRASAPSLPRMLLVTLYIAKLYQPLAPSAYNLTRLAALADRVFLMGYDMSWNGATPGSGAHEAGPNSPLDGLASALTTAVDALGAKPATLLLGLPLYGRLYN